MATSAPTRPAIPERSRAYTPAPKGHAWAYPPARMTFAHASPPRVRRLPPPTTRRARLGVSPTGGSAVAGDSRRAPDRGESNSKRAVRGRARPCAGVRGCGRRAASRPSSPVRGRPGAAALRSELLSAVRGVCQVSRHRLRELPPHRLGQAFGTALARSPRGGSRRERSAWSEVGQGVVRTHSPRFNGAVFQSR